MSIEVVLGEKISAHEAQKENKPKGLKPLIGFCIDWRIDPITKELYAYSENIRRNRQAIESAGGQSHLLTWNDSLDSFIGLLDGYLIPGGRDINPKFYGEEVNGSIINEDGDHYYLFQKRVYFKLPKSVPIFGICCGFQFLNVVNGGSLIQHLPDHCDHQKQRRTITFKENSVMEKIMGSFVESHCFHHQGIGRLGKNIEITGKDDISNIPHALELKDSERNVFGLLFHPEYTIDKENNENEQKLREFYRYFIGVADAYRMKRRTVS